MQRLLDPGAAALTRPAQGHAAAVEADREVWAAVEPQQRFWLPSTNIIGAVCENSQSRRAQEWNARRQEVQAATSPAALNPVPQQDA